MLPLVAASVRAQKALSWQDIQAQFEASNPALSAAKANVEESKAAEISAYLRPNPNVTGLLDQFTPFSSNPSPNSNSPVYRPLANVLPYGSISYLHERQHKRELRLESSRQATEVMSQSMQDLKRNLLFNLRNAFVLTLQSKAQLQNARNNLEYWDRELALNRQRLAAGDLAEIDLNRLELLRAQFQADHEASIVALRTSKIQLLQLLNSRAHVDEFDVDGPFEFGDGLKPLEEFRQAALAARPDLAAAVESVKLAETNHKLAVANGSADPTFSLDLARNPPLTAYMGFSVSIPLRIFDRNQGEKLRTEIDIRRNQRLRDTAESQVFSDVDSAYTTLEGALNQLRPYKHSYLAMAAKIRDRVEFSFKHGGASLLDYLDAEKSYRDTRLAYLNLVGSYLVAAAQMNLAAGSEVIP